MTFFPRFVLPAVTALCWVVLRQTWVVGAAEPPNLPFGDINIIVVTDVHSFIAGHPHEIDRNADYGDVLSFYQHVKSYCDEQGHDLWFFMNGDWVHGTGLAMDGNATMLVPLLKEMPWDVVNLGNHEMYYSAIVELMRDDMIPHFGGAFLTSNTLDAETMEPFGGARFRLLKGKKSTVLTFGFLYDLTTPSSLLHVSKVEETLEEDWFRDALREHEYDAICVLAHMDNDDPLVEKILTKIREHTDAHMPVQFLTGHTHVRKQRKIGKDLWGRAMEAGGNLDTVGFLSIPTKDTAESVSKGEVGDLFQYQFLNASKEVLKEAAGVETLLTTDGTALAQRINETRYNLGLEDTVGCPPRDYFLDRSIHDEDSVFKLWMDHVVPTQIFKNQKNCAMLISADSFRYDVRGSGRNDAMTVDDIVALVPYMEPVMYVGEVPEWVVRRMNISMNTDSLNHHHLWPDYLLAGKFDFAGDKNKAYKLYTHEYDVPEVMHDLDRLHEHSLKPSKTDFKDTLYWLEYVESAWLCEGHRQPKQVKPWFADIKELDEEDGDGGRTSEDMTELDKEMDREDNNDLTDKGNNLHYEGYEGYLPPSAIEQFGDKLPPGISPSVPQKPKPPPPPTAGKKTTKHGTAADKAARMEHRKKVRRTLFKVMGGLIAVCLLLIPACGLYRVFFPDKSDSGMTDETFYDMKEMRSLRRRGKRKAPMIHEIQLT